jgi:sugar phosphate isomerase/epimerase
MEVLLNSIALEPNRWTPKKIPHFRLRQLLPAIAGAGYDAVETWQNHVALLGSDEIGALKEAAAENEIRFPIVGMYPSFHLEGEERRQELHRFDEMIKIGGRLGFDLLKVMSGGVSSEDMTPDVWDRSVAFVREVLSRTHQWGVDIAFELHGGTVADDPETLLRFFDEVGSERLKVCWQPLGFQSTEPAIELYDRLSDRVAHLHLQGRRDGEMTLLKDAEIDYREVLGHMFDEGFDGYVSIEFVRGCVVDSPDDMDLGAVLENARKDREFIEGVHAYRE